MIKKSLFAVFILSVISGVILFVQWLGFEKSSQAFSEMELEQLIKVEHTASGFKIVQQLTNVPKDKDLSVVVPPQALNISCENKSDQCSFRGQLGVITPGKSTVSISYTLKDQGGAAALLLSDWFIKVKEANLSYTTIELTERKLREGTWYSNADEVKNQKGKLVDFYLFERKGEAVDLYWQKEPLSRMTFNKKITVYAPKETVINSEVFSEVKGVADLDPPLVIMTKAHPSYSSATLVLVQDENQLGLLSDQFLIQYIHRAYQFTEGQKWFSQLIQAYMKNRPVGSPKAQEMYTHLQTKLSKDQHEKWKEKILHVKERVLTAEEMDQMLSSVVKLDTHFFTENKNENQLFKPLTLYDTRPVYIEEGRSEVQMVHRNGMILFPLQETLEELGFSVKAVSNERTLLIKKEYDTYRFFLDQNRFILNEDDYGIYNNALQTIDGEVYIDKNWLQKIFLTSVSEQSDRISINMLDYK
ncbi:hypothetical protein JOC78_000161 [Bacillus ectoiniformans]|uniref:stalk domain-containing protein n=1 Tax=Bacillus ectoiniformans TaxID=1494429 RepID=UPI00195DDF74|nr:stalk domain-containing protein [Bacillus ectoiniformans]MBM7647240.1 hypothetical protein [Bacillus ectoiniformans]